MIWFLVKRVFWMLLTMWAVFTICFFLMRALPGNPLTAERKVSPEVERNLRKRYHLDEPPLKQYVRELGRAARGDLGYSIRIADLTVNEILAAGFPVSASLGILAMFFALTLGISAGIVSATRRKSVADFGLMTVATLGIALPNFVVASVAILLLVFVWPLFPAAGWGTIESLILPSMALGGPFAAYIARLTRTGLLDVLNQDYIRTALAKGLSPRRVIFGHAIKGAMLPVVSFLGPAVAGVLAGSLVIEKMFAIPGLAVTFINAAQQRDFPLAMGEVLLYTGLLCSLNIIVDITYTLLDPRVKLE